MYCLTLLLANILFNSVGELANENDSALNFPTPHWETTINMHSKLK